MKCMKNERLEAYQVKKILKMLVETVKKRFGVRENVLGGKKTLLSREIKKNEKRIALNIYIYIYIYRSSVNLDR